MMTQTRIRELATADGVVPFPLARRRAFIERHARLIATMRPETGERYLDRQLQIQFENLQRRGFDARIIECTEVEIVHRTTRVGRNLRRRAVRHHRHSIPARTPPGLR